MSKDMRGLTNFISDIRACTPTPSWVGVGVGEERGAVLERKAAERRAKAAAVRRGPQRRLNAFAGEGAEEKPAQRTREEKERERNEKETGDGKERNEKAAFIFGLRLRKGAAASPLSAHISTHTAHCGRGKRQRSRGRGKRTRERNEEFSLCSHSAALRSCTSAVYYKHTQTHTHTHTYTHSVGAAETRRGAGERERERAGKKQKGRNSRSLSWLSPEPLRFRVMTTALMHSSCRERSGKKREGGDIRRRAEGEGQRRKFSAAVQSRPLKEPVVFDSTRLDSIRSPAAHTRAKTTPIPALAAQRFWAAGASVS